VFTPAHTNMEQMDRQYWHRFIHCHAWPDN